MIFVDNLALAFSVGKGRSCNHTLLRVNQKIGALALACGLVLRVRWIPPELNVSDGPSRGSKLAGWFKDGQLVRKHPKELLTSQYLTDTSWGVEQQRSEESGAVEDEESDEERSEVSGRSESRTLWRRREKGSEGKLHAGSQQHQWGARGSIPALSEMLQGFARRAR